MVKRSGVGRVRADIAAAAPASPLKAPQTGGTAPPPPPPRGLTGRFHLKDDGLWMDRADDKPPLWVCGRLEAIAETRDADGYFGILWGWRDRVGRERQEVFAREMFAGEAGEMSRAMAARGLTFNATREARQAFLEYVNLASASAHARVVARTGWHTIGGTLIYVLPDQIFGNSPIRVILQTTSREPDLFQHAGTLADWRAAIGRPCRANARLGLAVSMAFAAPLLRLVGEDGGGVNLHGDSRSGKTTCGIVSASVWGGDPSGDGAIGAVRSWRSTSNSTEAVAALHSDIGLVMDELGQADARDVGACQYMLASGQGKSRLDRGVGLRAVLRFRVFFLSTGETTLAAKMAEAGIKMKAGQGVRLVDVPADDGAGTGAFTDLHGAESAGAFAQELREAAIRYYGTPMRAYIAYLIGRIEREPGFADQLKDEIDRIATAWLAPFGAHSGQARTVARRFALIALAGNLATDAGITGWANTETGEREAEFAARKCFLAWLDERGTVDNHEDAQAVAQLRAFISKHWSARLSEWRSPEVGDQTQPTGPQHQRYIAQNAAGWRKWVDRQWEFFLSAEGMREALTGLDYKAALKVLVARGMILPGKNEIAKSLNVTDVGKQRLYHVPASVISAGLDAPAADG